MVIGQNGKVGLNVLLPVAMEIVTVPGLVLNHYMKELHVLVQTLKLKLATLSPVQVSKFYSFLDTCICYVMFKDYRIKGDKVPRVNKN